MPEVTGRAICRRAGRRRSASGVQVPLALEHLLALELQRHVVDAEQAHGVVGVLEHV